MQHRRITPKLLIFLVLACSGAGNESMETLKQDGKLIIRSGERDLLTYQYETMYPPEGVDSLFKRSGFIHPLKTPSGKVLTRIQPEDHYHHYGVWNPWTHTLFEGDTLDFWNLYKNEGTVEHAGFEFVTENKDYAEFAVHHEHVVLKDGKNKTALNELQIIRVHKPENGSYIIDYSFEYTPATDSPFKILEYRYGGFGWRATPEWTDSTSTVLTSEGISDRAEADGSHARWVIIEGKLGDSRGGAVLLGSPGNFNHPEPIRIWPEGDMFICFFPTKFSDWLFEPGTNYTLKYRMIVFDGEYTAEQAENAFIEYAKSGSKY